jgi:hypothetical protein
MRRARYDIYLLLDVVLIWSPKFLKISTSVFDIVYFHIVHLSNYPDTLQ